MFPKIKFISYTLVDIKYRFWLNRLPILLTTDSAHRLWLGYLEPRRSTSYIAKFMLVARWRAVTCDPEWSATVREDTNSLGGRLISQPLSESGCLDLCAYDVSGCLAVDVDHNERPYPACWVHVNAGDLDTVFQTAGVKQHRINTTWPLCLWPTTGWVNLSQKPHARVTGF